MVKSLKSSNIYNQDTASALYERAKPKLQATRIQSIPLSAESLQHLIAECAISASLRRCASAIWLGFSLRIGVSKIIEAQNLS